MSGSCLDWIDFFFEKNFFIYLFICLFLLQPLWVLYTLHALHTLIGLRLLLQQPLWVLYTLLALHTLIGLKARSFIGRHEL